MNTVAPSLIQPFGDRQVAVAVAAGGESTCALTCKGYGNEWDGGGDMGTLSAPSQSTDAKGDYSDRWKNKMDGPKSGANSKLTRQAKKQVSEIADLLSQLGQLDAVSGEGESGGEVKADAEAAVEPPTTTPTTTDEVMPSNSTAPPALPPPGAGASSELGPPPPRKNKKRLSAKLNRVEAVALPPPPQAP